MLGFRLTGFSRYEINSELGYKPVPFSELTTDQVLEGCQTCN
jgi:hypothetical protein